MFATKSTLEKLLEIGGKFVIQQKGAWGHGDWEALLGQVAASGIDMSDDEGKRNLGNILEAAKYFYFVAPPAPRPKAAPKKRAAR